MSLAPEGLAALSAGRLLRHGLTAVCLALWLLPLGFAVAAVPLAAGMLLLTLLPRHASLAPGRWLLAFVLVSLGMIPFVPFPGVHLAALTATYLMWAGYWQVLGTLPPSGHELSRIARAVAGSGTLFAAIGLANRLGLAFFWWWGGGVKDPWLVLDLNDRYRVASGIGMNPNILAGCLLLTWPLALDLALRSSGRRRWLWLAATLLQWTTLLLTHSRGGALALVVVAGLWAARRADVRRSLAGLAGALTLTVVLAWPVWQPLAGRLATLADGQVSSNVVRQSLWRSGLTMVADRPLTGVGVAAFQLAYPPYRHPEDIYNSDHLHNWYLQTAVESGLPAAGLFFVAVLGIVRTAKRGQHPATEATLGFAVFGLGDYLFHDPRVLMLIWTVWALGMQAGVGQTPADAVTGDRPEGALT